MTKRVEGPGGVGGGLPAGKGNTPLGEAFVSKLENLKGIKDPNKRVEEYKKICEEFKVEVRTGKLNENDVMRFIFVSGGLASPTGGKIIPVEKHVEIHFNMLDKISDLPVVKKAQTKFHGILESSMKNWHPPKHAEE